MTVEIFAFHRLLNHNQYWYCNLWWSGGMVNGVWKKIGYQFNVVVVYQVYLVRRLKNIFLRRLLYPLIVYRSNPYRLPCEDHLRFWKFCNKPKICSDSGTEMAVNLGTKSNIFVFVTLPADYIFLQRINFLA